MTFHCLDSPHRCSYTITCVHILPNFTSDIIGSKEANYLDSFEIQTWRIRNIKWTLKKWEDDGKDRGGLFNVLRKEGQLVGAYAKNKLRYLKHNGRGDKRKKLEGGTTVIDNIKEGAGSYNGMKSDDGKEWSGGACSDPSQGKRLVMYSLTYLK